MDTRTLTATTESAGARLDAFLAAQLPDVTRSAAARLIESGCVTVNGATADTEVSAVRKVHWAIAVRIPMSRTRRARARRRASGRSCGVPTRPRRRG